MILLEVIDAERRKLVAALSPASDDAPAPGPSRRQSNPPSSSPPRPSSPRLPDYATSQAEAEEAEKAEKQQVEDILRAAKKKQGRLRRYLVYALVVYLVLSVSIGVPLFVVLRKDAQRANVEMSEKWMNSEIPPPPPPPGWLPPDVSSLSVVSGSVVSCNDWTPDSTSGGPDYTLRYSMPLSDTIYVWANFSDVDEDETLQSPVSGSLRVSVVNGSNATVTVTARNVDDAFFKESHVCLTESNNTAWGLNISLPSILGRGYYFDILLELPPEQDDSPLCNFVTYLPLFNQSFDSLDSFTDINTVDVEGSLGSIYFESVQARNILVKASASSITGTFNATNKLILDTVLRPITANVSLYSYGGYGQNPTHLSVGTGNNNISLNVNLYSLSNDTAYCPPFYMTSVSTFNGAINAAYYHDPSIVSSKLYVRAVNSVEPAYVFVDRVFEGTYDVHTTLADAVVERNTELSDPAGEGRNRSFEDSYITSSRTYGWTGWGERPMNAKALQQGRIELVSSLSPAVLELTDSPNTDLLSNLIVLNTSRAPIPRL